MRIAGVTTEKRNTGTVTIYRDGQPVDLTVSPLPVNFRGRVAQAVPMPRPAVEYERRAGKVLRGPDGAALKVVRDDEPKYLAAVKRVDDLQGIVLAYQILRADPSIAWDTPPPREPWGDRAFAEAIETEMIAAGFTDGEVLAIIHEAERLEEGAPERVDELEKNSSPETATEASSRTRSTSSNSASPNAGDSTPGTDSTD